MIQLLLPVSDRPTIMIGAGGLLLVVSHLFAVPVFILWVGLEKSIKLKLGCEKYFVGSDTEHCSSCSNSNTLCPHMNPKS
jgi:hypothetical protein